MTAVSMCQSTLVQWVVIHAHLRTVALLVLRQGLAHPLRQHVALLVYLGTTSHDCITA